MSGYIRTVTGIKFFPLSPSPGDVRIEDIAHALSHQCRWAGHVKTHYSVALHSIHVSMMVHKEVALCALCHDAAEAYMCDLPKPVKEGMPEFARYEEQLMTVIAEALGFQWPMTQELKQADAAALYLESQYFFSFDRDIPKIDPPRHCNWNFPIVCSAKPSQVEEWFLQEFHRLKKL